MNNDLISRSALVSDYEDYLLVCESGGLNVAHEMLEAAREAPAVDAVEVVRCKDCVKRDQAFRCIALYYGFNPHDDWFCAEGERDNAEVHDDG